MVYKLFCNYKNTKYYDKLQIIYKKAKLMFTIIHIGYEWCKNNGIYSDPIFRDDVPQIFTSDWEEKILKSKAIY